MHFQLFSEWKVTRTYFISFRGISVVHEKKSKIEENIFQKLETAKMNKKGQELSADEFSLLKLEAEEQARDIDLNKACLCFEAFVENEIDKTLVQICEPVYSNTIRNTFKRAFKEDLVIKHMTPCQDSAMGGSKGIILCNPVKQGL